MTGFRGSVRRIWFLTGKDFFYMMRQKETLLWTFVLPFVFFFFIGTMTSGFGGGAPSGESMAVWAPDGGVLLPAIEARIEQLGYRVVHPDSQEGLNAWMRQLTFPAAFSDSVLAGRQARVRYRRASEDPLAGQYDDIRIQRALYETLADVVVLLPRGGPSTAEAFRARVDRPRLISLRTESVGARREEEPSGFQQAVPGTMVMFILLILFTSGAILLVDERKEGTLKRLAAAPVRRAEVLGAKGLARLGVGLIQIPLGMAAGAFLFGVSWGAHPFTVVGILVLYGAIAALLGILLGSFARTPGQAVGLGILVTNVLAALGGCWWPIELTPGWMQKAALLLPTGWAMDALHRLTAFGDPPAAVVPHAAVMVAAIGILLYMGNRAFRYD